MPQFTLLAELGAQKCRRNLGDKFGGGVRFLVKAGSTDHAGDQRHPVRRAGDRDPLIPGRVLADHGNQPPPYDRRRLAATGRSGRGAPLTQTEFPSNAAWLGRIRRLAEGSARPEKPVLVLTCLP